jgi:hypothetical protein
MILNTPWFDTGFPSMKVTWNSLAMTTSPMTCPVGE